MATKNAVRVKDLSKTFKGSDSKVTHAIDSISFDIAEGEFFTLLGPSGCGKTTTLRSVAGLEQPDGGSIEIGGELVYSQESRTYIPANRRQIGMVFQSYAIWPHMSVFENVAFPLRSRGVGQPEISETVGRALRMVGLEDFGGRSATQLSGGQQQRVALARASVTSKTLLILDEPLSNLDASLRDQMRTELRDIQEKTGTTTLYVTHDQEEALELSDRICVMNKGSILEIGTPQELYRNPKHLFTADFLGDMELWPCTIVSSDSERVVVDSPIGRVEVRNRGALVTGEKTILAIRPEFMTITLKEPRKHDSASRALNRVDGVVRESHFGGKLVRYVVQVGELMVRVKALSQEIHTPGTDVELYLPTELCLIMEGDADNSVPGGHVE